MGKRSTFKRRPQDDYRTWDRRAGDRLRPHLSGSERYWEPCAGAMDLVHQIPGCVVASDIVPKHRHVLKMDSIPPPTGLLESVGVNCIITNPPWTRVILHEMITVFSDMYPTWLLFDADWIHTLQSAPYMDRLRHVVSVGKLRWIPGTDHDSVDNCAWYLFDRPSDAPTVFSGRV